MFDTTEVVAIFAGLTAAVTVIGGLKIGPAAIMTGFRWLVASVIK